MNTFLKVLKRIGFIILLALSGACFVSGDPFGVGVGFLFFGCMLWVGERIYKEYKSIKSAPIAESEAQIDLKEERCVRIAENLVMLLIFRVSCEISAETKRLPHQQDDKTKIAMAQYFFGSLHFMREFFSESADITSRLYPFYNRICSIVNGSESIDFVEKNMEILNNQDSDMGVFFLSGYSDLKNIINGRSFDNGSYVDFGVAFISHEITFLSALHLLLDDKPSMA